MDCEKDIVTSMFPANHLRSTVPQAGRKHSPLERFTTLDRWKHNDVGLCYSSPEVLYLFLITRLSQIAVQGDCHDSKYLWNIHPCTRKLRVYTIKCLNVTSLWMHPRAYTNRDRCVTDNTVFYDSRIITVGRNQWLSKRMLPVWWECASWIADRLQ